MDGKLSRAERHGDRGVSLIELLVVVAILAVFAVGVSILPARNGQAAAQSRLAFETQFAAVRDMAIQGRDVYGMRITAREMQTMRLRDGRWQDMGPPTRWRGRAILSGAQAVGTDPDILILPDGRYSGFALQVAGGRCSGNGWEPVTCDG